MRVVSLRAPDATCRLVLHGPNRGALSCLEHASPAGAVRSADGSGKSPAAMQKRRPGYPAELRRQKRPTGDITVADPMNCRVLVLDPSTKTVLGQIGTPVYFVHNPPSEVGSPNGDTPLANGDLLVSGINGSWVDEYTTSGQPVWDVQLPIGYPSDPQQVGPDRCLVADYESPGGIVEFNRAGQVLYRYQRASGPGELNHPSLAELLPSGVFLLNDDYNDRMAAIAPATGALVCQYGETGVAGTAPGLLNTPDGFDMLGPGGTTPPHPTPG